MSQEYDYDRDYDILFPKITHKEWSRRRPTGVTLIGEYCNCRERWERYDAGNGEPFEHRCDYKAYQRISDYEKMAVERKEKQNAELADLLKKLLSALASQ